MTLSLPDVARHERPRTLLPLDWVGMRGIDVPVRLSDPVYPTLMHARADACVDLPDIQVKGIHMSRLHRLVHDFVATQPLAPAALAVLLRDMVASHRDCGTTAAKVAFRLDVLRARPALVTQGLSGWQAYPVVLEAVLRDGAMQITLAATVLYSSTCPCSAALSRQALQEAFVRNFGDGEVAVALAASWLMQHGSLATPHSQRSQAEVRVTLAPDAVGLPLEHLIGTVEQALGTPVQTAVKRADEQAFARLNGDNLMYVEDAARKIQAALRGDRNFRSVAVSVRHLESLHPHDAVASVTVVA